MASHISANKAGHREKGHLAFCKNAESQVWLIGFEDVLMLILIAPHFFKTLKSIQFL